MKNKGFFISLEGGEGCGKSTQLGRIAEKLQTLYPGREIIITRSPGGTAVAERIRNILKEKEDGEEITPETELLLFGACHAQMVRTLIRPAMERGAILLTDRFIDSTIVYQGFARGLDRKMIDHINTFACGSTLPHLTLLLDLSPEDGAKRTNARADVSRDRFDSESRTFHEAIRNGFLTLAKDAPERFAVINAAREMDAVTADIMEVLRDRMA